MWIGQQWTLWTKKYVEDLTAFFRVTVQESMDCILWIEKQLEGENQV